MPVATDHLTILRSWTPLTDVQLAHPRVHDHHRVRLHEERQAAMTYVWGRQDEAQDRDGNQFLPEGAWDEVNGFASTWERHCWEYLTEQRCNRFNMRDAYDRYITETRQA